MWFRKKAEVARDTPITKSKGILILSGNGLPALAIDLCHICGIAYNSSNYTYPFCLGCYRNEIKKSNAIDSGTQVSKLLGAR